MIILIITQFYVGMSASTGKICHNTTVKEIK